MKYLIIGPTLSGNQGAASMVLATVASMGTVDPEAKFTLLSYYPTEDRSLQHPPNLEVLDARPVRLAAVIGVGALLWRVLPPLRSIIESSVPEIAALAEADVVLDQGGITFSDGREKFLIFNVATLFPGLVMGVPTVKCAQAMGPFEGKVNRGLAKLLLPRLSAIVARGAVTEAHLDRLELGNVSLGTDIAFLLPPPGEDDISAAEAVFDSGAFRSSPIVVGIAPSVVIEKKVDAKGGNYRALMREVIERQVELGRQVVLIPHSLRADPASTHNNDGPLVEDLARGFDPDVVRAVGDRLGPEALRHIIGSCDVFVSCRFHAMISSLSMAVPTLVLGWSHKYGEILDLFDQGEFCLDNSQLDADRIEVLLERLLLERIVVAEQLSNRLPAVRELAAKQVDLIAEAAGK